MIWMEFIKIWSIGALFALGWFTPLFANGVFHESVEEKRIRLAIRMVGHEVLLNVGDVKSRVLPIEKAKGRYQISFESAFAFDPGDLVAIFEKVMAENNIAANYIVEVAQCTTQLIVHSFEIRHSGPKGMIPCLGRVLPPDCYNLLVTIVDTSHVYQSAVPLPLEPIAIGGAYSHPSLTSSNHSVASVWNGASWVWGLLLLTLLVGMGYILRKNQRSKNNPALITLGSSRFDPQKMTITVAHDQISLSHKETALLSLLHTHANEPVERAAILKKVWENEGDYIGRTLDVFISKLRKKLMADPSLRIVNIRGVGYKLIID